MRWQFLKFSEKRINFHPYWFFQAYLSFLKKCAFFQNFKKLKTGGVALTRPGWCEKFQKKVISGGSLNRYGGLTVIAPQCCNVEHWNSIFPMVHIGYLVRVLFKSNSHKKYTHKYETKAVGEGWFRICFIVGSMDYQDKNMFLQKAWQDSCFYK